jgi:hypothetical protein
MKHIFLLSGQGQHGKDSTAIFLKEKLQGSTLIIHYADYLKFIAKNYMGWSGEKDVAGRTLLQLLGTERVKYDLKKPLYWVERVCDIIEIVYDQYDYFCVPDVRFISEIHYPEARFPQKTSSIRITRLNFDNGFTLEQKNHISELELVHYPHDYYITSESGLDKLEIEVNKFLIEYNKNSLSS